MEARMRRLAIFGLLPVLMVLLGLATTPAMAQDQWPPPEVTTQPHPDPVDPVPPVAPATTSSSDDGGWSLADYTAAAVAIIGALGTAFGGGLGAYHFTCKRDSLQLTRGGSLDWEALASRLDRIEAGQAAILEAIQPAPSRPAPAGSPRPQLPQPSQLPTNPDPAPLRTGVGSVLPL
jgi:hypothetical protein